MGEGEEREERGPRLTRLDLSCDLKLGIGK